jgi:Ca-activated chloride channel family protein
VPADDAGLQHIAVSTGGSFHTAYTEQELRTVYRDINGEIGHKTVRVEDSWRYLFVGQLLLFASGSAALLWSGRLV